VNEIGLSATQLITLEAIFGSLFITLSRKLDGKPRPLFLTAIGATLLTGAFALIVWDTARVTAALGGGAFNPRTVFVLVGAVGLALTVAGLWVAFSRSLKPKA
jgi:hypothetical protein